MNILTKTFKCYSRHIEMRAYIRHDVTVSVLNDLSREVAALVAGPAGLPDSHQPEIAARLRVSSNRAGLHLAFMLECEPGSERDKLLAAGWKESKS